MKQLMVALGALAVVCVEEGLLAAILANERGRQQCIAQGGVVVETADEIRCMLPAAPAPDEEA